MQYVCISFGSTAAFCTEEQIRRQEFGLQSQSLLRLKTRSLFCEIWAEFIVYIVYIYLQYVQWTSLDGVQQ